MEYRQHLQQFTRRPLQFKPLQSSGPQNGVSESSTLPVIPQADVNSPMQVAPISYAQNITRCQRLSLGRAIKTSVLSNTDLPDNTGVGTSTRSIPKETIGYDKRAAVNDTFHVNLPSPFSPTHIFRVWDTSDPSLNIAKRGHNLSVDSR